MEEHFSYMIAISNLVIAASLAYGAVFFSIKLCSIARSLRNGRKK